MNTTTLSSAPVCWHDRASKTVGPTTHQINWYCPDCGCTRTTYPEVFLASREKSPAAPAAFVAHEAENMSDNAGSGSHVIDKPATGAAPAAAAGTEEMSPEFTDTARAALLWVLWHHQGASSKVGQPIRFALGMGQHEHLNEHQVREAKRWEALATPPFDSGAVTGERSAFEADYLSRFKSPGYLGKDQNGNYGHVVTRARWHGWQARAALQSAQKGGA